MYFPVQRKSFDKMPCPIARALDRVGEWWSILIIRDALHGFTRFDEFQTSLNIAPNMLTRRLNALIDAAILERRRYSDRPPRYEYILTEMGREFRPVLVAMFAWGNKYFTPEGPNVLLVEKKNNTAADPIMIDRRSGRPITERDFAFVAGPAAGERTRKRYATVIRKQSAAGRQSARRKPARKGSGS